MNFYENRFCAAYSRAAGKPIICIKIIYDGIYNGTCEGCDGALVDKLMNNDILSKKKEQHLNKA